MPSSTEMPNLTASRQDFELFQRFLRVARLLQASDNDTLLNQDLQLLNNGSALRSSQEHGLGFSGLDMALPDAPSNSRNDPGMDMDLDDNEDEYDDDDDDTNDDDAEDEYEDAPKRRQRNGQRKTNNSSNKTSPSPGPGQQQHGQQRHHASVEKRYRSVVNGKIQQLHDLIPESNTFTPTDPTAPHRDSGAGAGLGTQAEAGETTASQRVPSKSVVLNRALQYVNHLVSTYEQYEAERNELRGKLKLWLDDTSSHIAMSGQGAPSDGGVYSGGTTATTAAATST